MKKLIITADDYGMSKAVNRAIDAGIEAGLITSTNVMTNMDFYEEAIKLKSTKASVGLHWTLSCGKPVLDAKAVKTLVTKEGCFYKYPEFRKRYRKGLISDEEIEKELVAQYNRYVNLMGEPDYWNTHQNVHVDFKIYALFVAVAKKLNISKMRSHQRIYVPAMNSDSKLSLKWKIMEPIKVSLLNAWQKNAHKKGISSPDGMIVCLNKSDAMSPDYTFSNVMWKENEIGEFVIHPATECDSPYFGSIGEQRIHEYTLFTDEKTLASVSNAKIELVNYDVVDIGRRK